MKQKSLSCLMKPRILRADSVEARDLAQEDKVELNDTQKAIAMMTGQLKDIIARVQEDHGRQLSTRAAQEHHVAENRAGSLRSHAAEGSVYVGETMVIRFARRPLV